MTAPAPGCWPHAVHRARRRRLSLEVLDPQRMMGTPQAIGAERPLFLRPASHRDADPNGGSRLLCGLLAI